MPQTKGLATSGVVIIAAAFGPLFGGCTLGAPEQGTAVDPRTTWLRTIKRSPRRT